MKKRVYMDYAAATPLSKEASRAMEPFLKVGLTGDFGNAASVHKEGLIARDAIEASRASIAHLLEVHKDEIIFTSGGTEGNNLIIKGVIGAAMGKIKNPEIITSVIEHSAILGPLSKFESVQGGMKITRVRPDKKISVSPVEIEKALTKNTILVSIALVNSELGSIAPIRDISRVIEKFKKKLGRGKNDYPYLHTDASQAGALLPLAPHNLGVDFLTADSNKFYGPKGIGFMYIGREKAIAATIFGGGQEKGLRPGTLNTAGIVGMAAALKEAAAVREKEWSRLTKLQNNFVACLKAIFNDHCHINSQDYKNLPNFVNVCIDGIDAEFLAVKLDVYGVACSAASACRSISGEGSSYVIAAIPGKTECASSSLRFSFGKYTTIGDVNYALKVLEKLTKMK